MARHGEEALDYLFRRGEYQDAARSPRPRLILLDLRLPRVDGLEVLAEIKSSPDLRAIPTVVLTTSESEHDVARACAHHANSYLVKPVEFARFEELIGSVESYWLTLNRQPGEGARPARHDGSVPAGSGPAASAAARSCHVRPGARPGGTEQAVERT